jgi:predicted RNA binding protein YcfA (HicA-like mRNA interferase family)
MTERDILRLLKQDGWIITEGARHHLATHPAKAAKIPVPRHRGDIPTGTAKEILKAAGIDLK